MKKNCHLWQLDREGNLHFPIRSEQLPEHYRADSGWESPSAAIVVMLVCGLLDFVVFKQLFATMLYDYVLIQWLSIIGCLVAFDLAPIYMGILVRKKAQGYRTGTFVIALLLFAFLMVLAGNVALRIIQRNVLVPDLSSFSSSVLGPVENTSQENEVAYPYAIFSSMLPLATSIVSFAVSYISSDPLKARLRLLHREHIELEDAIGMLDSVLLEYEIDPDLKGRLLADDDYAYFKKLQMARERGLQYCDYVRERLKEHLGEASSTNELSKDIHGKLLAHAQPVGAAPAEEETNIREYHAA